MYLSPARCWKPLVVGLVGFGRQLETAAASDSLSNACPAGLGRNVVEIIISEIGRSVPAGPYGCPRRSNIDPPCRLLKRTPAGLSLGLGVKTSFSIIDVGDSHFSQRILVSLHESMKPAAHGLHSMIPATLAKGASPRSVFHAQHH
jgi:hypothetical protein